MTDGSKFDFDRHPTGTVSLTVDGVTISLDRQTLLGLVRESRRWDKPIAAAASEPARMAPQLTELESLTAAIVKRAHMRASDEQQLLQSLELFCALGDLRELTRFAGSLRIIQAMRISGTLRRRIDEMLSAEDPDDV